MRLTERLHLGRGRENRNIRLILCARSEALVGHNIKKDSIQSLSLIESELNAKLVRRCPILVGLSFVQSVEIVDDVYLRVFEHVYNVIVFEGLPEKCQEVH